LPGQKELLNRLKRDERRISPYQKSEHAILNCEIFTLIHADILQLEKWDDLIVLREGFHEWVSIHVEVEHVGGIAYSVGARADVLLGSAAVVYSGKV